jgi:hypothetical protein
MKLIERYIYAVTKDLPQKQREDIGKEIRTLIDDMLEQQQGDEPYENKIQRVLLSLGDPELLADSYRESKRYLIGPQNFDNYIMLLKLVSGAVFLGISIATVIDGVFSSQSDIINIIVDYIATMFYALLQGFAWVTVGFAIAEHNGVSLTDKKKKKVWSLSDLPALPEKAAAIPRVESVFAILFSTIFTSIFYFAPQLFAAYIGDGTGSMTIIPVFNIEALFKYKTFILVVFILGIIKEALKLITGRWNLKLSFSLTILNILSLILTLAIFTDSAVWNVNFIPEVLHFVNIETQSLNQWMNFSTGTIIIFIFAYIIEIVTNLYKGIKFNK